VIHIYGIDGRAHSAAIHHPAAGPSPQVVNSSMTATVCTACSAAVMGLAVLVIAILILTEPFVADLPHTEKSAGASPLHSAHLHVSY